MSSWLTLLRRWKKHEIAFVCDVHPKALLGCPLCRKKRFLTLTCSSTAVIIKENPPLLQIPLMHFWIISPVLVALFPRQQDTSAITQMPELSCSFEPLQLFLHKPLSQLPGLCFKLALRMRGKKDKETFFEDELTFQNYSLKMPLLSSYVTYIYSCCFIYIIRD